MLSIPIKTWVQPAWAANFTKSFGLRARSTCIMKEILMPSCRQLTISSNVSRQSFLRAKLSSVKK